ncbi:MAG: hypothetical protein WAT16_03090, partial [Saprospiraceae bacterium]
MKQIKILFLLVFIGIGKIYCQENGHSGTNSSATGHEHAPGDGHNHGQEAQMASPGAPAAHAEDHGNAKFDPKATAFHHISDLNVYSIGPWNFPLPCILYAPA